MKRVTVCNGAMSAAVLCASRAAGMRLCFLKLEFIYAANVYEFLLCVHLLLWLKCATNRAGLDVWDVSFLLFFFWSYMGVDAPRIVSVTHGMTNMRRIQTVLLGIAHVYTHFIKYFLLHRFIFIINYHKCIKSSHEYRQQLNDFQSTQFRCESLGHHLKMCR